MKLLNENGELIPDDIKGGATIALPSLNLAAGGTVYGDISHTSSLVDFDFSPIDTFYDFQENLGEVMQKLYNNLIPGHTLE